MSSGEPHDGGPGRDRPGPPPGPAPDRAALWLLRSPSPEPGHGPGDGEAAARRLLDAAERHRADRFVRPADRQLYTAAHATLRRLLGRHTGTPPGEVRLTREPCARCGGPHGRPVLAAPRPGPPLYFSLSHGAGHALIGLARVPIGVDIDRLPGEATVEYGAPALHPDERRELAAARAGGTHLPLFARIWTRKEAYLKGLGTGLCRPAHADYLGDEPLRHPPGWTVTAFTPPGAEDRLTAAVALRAPAPAVTVHRLPRPW
ncbi:4'-phosphopantetheinyl transferase superfamily protein [Streptomyces sp. CSDS2]|uniref:4'-phosphopantetheinyl transferase family protein n=1 Tax=Streptomyces sp. CSDS2 TaxID=3055051 RepID=UPI0025AFB43B|nr:4'-phosphopantetheinyl transferase superfamily protein [Streptomyces sp. CSDS2]MDN3265709.1 4'-phosphopantetheinyl transferase superfamily protein [Streptomyces sp. CSDS2]